ncbi:MAG TPA: glycosyltransferase [Anaerolineaceae bacterium]|nr:glycosyltransferase [Anaerolineaceae bacterium]
MMRIAMLSYHTCPLATLGGKQTGGMNVYVRELTRFLGMAGIQVDVFTRSQDDHVPHVLHDLGYGNRIVHIPAGAETPLPSQELASRIPQFVDGILQFAREKDVHYDLVHSHYWMSGMAALELKQAWNVPIVQMFHTLVLMKNRVASDPSQLEGPYREQGERKVMQQADRIIAATPAELAQLQFLYKLDKRKVTIIPPGVDTARFYPIAAEEAKEFIGIPPHDRMILFVGRIEPLKGLETLIRAIAALRPTGLLIDCPHYLAVIGGEPDASQEEMSAEMARLQELVKTLGLGDLVLFLGKRSQDTLPYYYSAADVLVMPSHYESFGMVALEAMACGTPVIATQVGGLAFLVKDGESGFVVPDGDPIAMGEKLAQLICQDDLRNRLGDQAHSYAQQYAWEKITQQIITVYRELTSRG